MRLQPERSRLGTQTWHTSGPSREQEVLHYQWFADMGNLDAQRQLARMFAHGEQADLPRSLRYFRYALACRRMHLEGLQLYAASGAAICLTRHLHLACLSHPATSSRARQLTMLRCSLLSSKVVWPALGAGRLQRVATLMR